MAWVALKHMTFNGRSVQPGDPLPEVDSWGRAQAERKERAGLILHVPAGHVVEKIGRKLIAKPATSAHPEPTPAPPVETVEHTETTPPETHPEPTPAPARAPEPQRGGKRGRGR